MFMSAAKNQRSDWTGELTAHVIIGSRHSCETRPSCVESRLDQGADLRTFLILQK